MVINGDERWLYNDDYGDWWWLMVIHCDQWWLMVIHRDLMVINGDWLWLIVFNGD